MNEPYDYEASGFDGFLSRSIDDLSQTSLDGGGPVSNQLNFDRMQVSGKLGDTFRIGGISFNNTNITVNDGENDFLLIGDE